MAAGKTTLAQALARRLGWRAEDVDLLIEARERRTVADIFAREGEPYFRSVERQVICSLLPQRHAVVATGGGTFIDAENRAAINADGVSVWIDVPFDVLLTEFPPMDGGRSPTTASRWRCCTKTDASPTSRRRCASTPRARMRKSWSNNSSSSSSSDALSGSQRHSQQPRSARRRAPRIGRPEVRRGAGAGRPRRLRRRSECGRRSRAGPQPRLIVRGNHDKVAAGLDDAEDFNPMARSAAHWTREALAPRTLEYLRNLPAGPVIVDDMIEICHGSPLDEDLYVVADIDAARSMAVARNPSVSSATRTSRSRAQGRQSAARNRRAAGTSGVRHRHRSRLQVPDQPGSVGQPRDGDSRAAYAIVDVDQKRVTLYRVAYPIEAAQKKILDAGLPPMLAYRLGMGR